MKKLLILLIAAGSLLSACVAYDVQDRDRPGYRGDRDRERDSVPNRDRDRDRDGVPNRADRDRDGDRVPNWRDQQPDNPRRY